MKNNCYFREPVGMEAVYLEEEVTVLRIQKKKSN